MSNIINKIPLPVGVSLFLYRMLNVKRLISNNEAMEKDINRLLNIFCPDATEHDRKSIIKDIKRCFVRHLAKPQEYFLLGFKDKNAKERDEWITDFIKDTYLKKYAKIQRAKELQDKFFVYQRMKPYFKRDACLITGKADKNSFMVFVKKHSCFIAKPNTGSFGADTRIWDITEANPEKVFDDLTANNTSWILEELIQQVPEMGCFNPSSVNSVRIPTFKTKDGYVIFGTFMRMGRKGSVVDNAGAGGIFVRIDENTGKIISNGYTEHGEVFVQHPDSQVVFKGYQIPCWQDLRELAVQCHKELPEHKYIGWDFALTKDGWVLLEGNWGQFLCQQVSGQKPLKKQFVSLIKG